MKHPDHVVRRCSGGRVVAVGALALLLSAPTFTQARCIGDCDGSGDVDVSEIITLVNIAVGTAPVTACAANGCSSPIDVTCVISAVRAAIDGCSTESSCGNGLREGTEDCDDGGTCIGGSNAGTACSGESDCVGNGVCDGGLKAGTSCAADSACPATRCVHCRTFGGDGCAANCTMETDVTAHLVPGVTQGLGLFAGTSGAVIHGDVLTIPLPLNGTFVITLGKGANGTIPAVIRASSLQFPQIPVSRLACACLRGVDFKTCGGTLFDADGSSSASCTTGFVGSTECPPDKPCTFVHGPGNAATAVVGCGAAGLSGVNIDLSQNSGCGEIPGPIVIDINGPDGLRGSALVTITTAIGTSVGPCVPTFCSDSDPVSFRGQPMTGTLTTGMACCAITCANGIDGVTLDACDHGTPFYCDALGRGQVNGTLVSTFPALNQPTLGDICVTTRLVLR